MLLIKISINYDYSPLYFYSYVYNYKIMKKKKIMRVRCHKTPVNPPHPPTLFPLFASLLPALRAH